MALEAPPIRRHQVNILSAHYQLNGQIESVGPVDNFVNDPTRDSLTIYDARMTPSTPGSPLKTIARPQIVVRKSQIVLLYFASAEARASIRTLARRELLVAYTPLVVCRGYFHLPTEAGVSDFLSVVRGDWLPVTEAHIFPLIELPDPLPPQFDLVLVGRSQLHLYHSA